MVTARVRILVALAAVLAAGASLFGGFVLDDHSAVEASSCVTGPLELSKIFGRNFWCEPEGAVTVDAWRPWTVLSWWGLWHVGDGAAWVFHLWAVALHAACAVTVVAVMESLGSKRGAALLGGTLFAVMPIHMDAVASVVGMADVWSTWFVLLAVLAMGGRRPWLAIPCAALAVLSKESGVAVVPLLFVRAYLGRSSGDRGPWVAAGASAAGVGLLLYVRGTVLGGWAPTHVTATVNPLVDAAWGMRLPTAFALLGRYLALSAVPFPLSADYSHATITVEAPWSGGFFWLGMLCAGALVRYAWLRRTEVVAPLAVTWLALSFGVVSSVAVLSPALFAERLWYGPSAALAMIVGHVVHAGAGGAPGRARQVVGAVFVVANLLLASVHAWAWTTEERITAATVRASPDSARAHLWRTRVLLRAEDPEAAEAHARRALEIYPGYGPSEAYLAAALDLQGEPQAAVVHFRKAMTAAPHDPEVAGLFVQFLMRYRQLELARSVYAAHASARGGVGHPSVPVP